MRKKYPTIFCIEFIVVAILSVQLVHGQSQVDHGNTDSLRSFLKFTALWHNGLEWEKRINKISVIDLFAGVGIGAQSDDLNEHNAPTIFAPDVFAEYRNYYNLFHRITKQKKTRNNSADFFFGRVETILPIQGQNYFNLLFSQGWGAQRSLSKRIIVGCHIGLVEHFYYDKPPSGGFNYLKLEPLAQASISYVF